MSPEQFLLVGNLFSDAALLLTRNGAILAANRHMRRVGLEAERLVGRRLADMAATPAPQVEAYLRSCARSGEPVIGAIVLRDGDGRERSFRCDGALAERDGDSDRTQLVLRLTPKAESLAQFAALNQKIADLTEEIRRRRELERQLWDERESLRVTLSSIGDGVIVTDTEGRVTFVNPVAAELTGWMQEEAASRPLEDVFQIVNEQTRAPAENPALRSLKEGWIVGLANHTVLIAKDGSERAIDDSAAPIRSQDGKLLGVVLVFRDVTETRRLAMARSRLAALVQSSGDAIIAKQFDGVVTDWNAGAERLFGFTREEVIGRPLYETIVPPDRKEEFLDNLARVQRGELVEYVETVRTHKSGRRIPISLLISPIRDAEEEIVGASAIERDITQQKRTETVLRFLADASSSLAALVDYKSTLQKVARLAVPGFADWCGIDLAGLDGSLQKVAIAHVDPQRVKQAEEYASQYPPDPDAPRGVGNVVRTGESEMVSEVPDELLVAAARDEEHLRLMRELGLNSYICVPLRAPGRVIGALTFVLSGSQRRYGPEDLAVAEDLASRAAIALENARLYHEVREADQRKDEFLAMLAHELRNPLAPIRTGLDVLALHTGQDLETIELMQQQVEHLVRLVDDLLDVSRIIRGRIELRREPVEVSALVRRAVEGLRPVIDQHQHEVIVSAPDRPMWVDADPVRIAQVIGNLLNNACKYTQHGGRIELIAGRKRGDAEIVVRDNGVGIEPALLPKVFDLFMQGSRSLDRSQGGLGIGLTLVKNLVEMHGGSVAAASKGPGRGSEFSLRLPIIEHYEQAAAPERPKLGAASRRILVVDDNFGAAQMLAMLLATLGPNQVETATEGPAALALLPEFRPEMVLLDIGLPGMDGYEIARTIRENPQFDSILLVAVTGYGQEEDRRKSQAAGFDEHVVKPPSLESIEKLLVHPKLPGAGGASPGA